MQRAQKDSLSPLTIGAKTLHTRRLKFIQYRTGFWKCIRSLPPDPASVLDSISGSMGAVPALDKHQSPTYITKFAGTLIDVSRCNALHHENFAGLTSLETVLALQAESCEHMMQSIVRADFWEGDATKHFSVKKEVFSEKGGRQSSESGVW